MAAKSKKDTASVVSKVMKDVDEDIKAHRKFADKADKNHRSYRGLIEERSKAARWTNKHHPAYVLQSVETMVANLLDPSPTWKLRVAPTMDDPQAIETLLEGARANELLLQHQLSCDHYAEKQRVFDLQALITGLTVSKQYWVHKDGPRRKVEEYSEPIINVYGDEIGSTPRTRTSTGWEVYRDDPTTETIDVRDFIWHEGATSLATCDRVSHRVWRTYDEIKEMEADGKYGPEAGGEKCDTLRDSKSFGSDLYQREQSLFETDKAKNKIEVLECWVEGGRRCVVIANRKVLLADRPNPFWFDHLEYMYPFVVCSAMPDLFVIPGISEVELMCELQEMLWSITNQRLDNLELVNNAIFMIADDIEDPDALEFGPGERWLVPRPVEQTVKPWSPDVRVAEISLSAENLIKGDMQNVTGGLPMLSGDTSAVDQKTATGVSIISSLAQKRVAMKKQMFVWAKRRIGEQWCALNQQFIRTPRLVPIIGKDGAQAFETIRPTALQGTYAFEHEMVDESFMRQERRAEKQSLLQMFLQAAPVYKALGVPLNPKPFMEDYLKEFGVTDTERYFSQMEQMMPGPGLPGQLPGTSPPGLESGGGNGVTAPQSVDAAYSPSNTNSLSPEVMMQRMLASGGTQGGGVSG